jgi:hypothetical protein
VSQSLGCANWTLIDFASKLNLNEIGIDIQKDITSKVILQYNMFFVFVIRNQNG